MARLDPDRTLLGDLDLDHGKDCSRFKRKNAISGSRIALLLARCVAVKRAGIGTDCQGRVALHAAILRSKRRQLWLLASAALP